MANLTWRTTSNQEIQAKAKDGTVYIIDHAQSLFFARTQVLDLGKFQDADKAKERCEKHAGRAEGHA